MSKVFDVLHIQLANKNKDKIILNGETVKGKTIYTVSLFGGTEENRFGSWSLRDPSFSRTYKSLSTLLDDLFRFIKKRKLPVESIRIIATKGTPFAYDIKQPDKRVFTPKYRDKVFLFTRNVLTTRVRQVEVFFSKGKSKLIFLHVEKNKAHLLTPLAKDEIFTTLPEGKGELLRAMSKLVKNSPYKNVEYVVQIYGKYVCIETTKEAFLSTLSSLAYNKNILNAQKNL